MMTAGTTPVSGVRRPLRLAGGASAGIVVAVGGVLAGTGWLYMLRGLGWLGFGPRIGDALPLLQLAGFDGQPLARVLVAWALTGGLAGLALSRTNPRWRAVGAFAASLVLLLVLSQASYALTRNVRFSDILFTRTPGLGPVIEAAAFAVGCGLVPVALEGRHAGGLWSRRWAGQRAGQRVGLGELGLRGRQHRHDSENGGDREQVDERRARAGA